MDNPQDMTEIAGAIATVLAVTGVVLNNRRRVGCFYFWMLSNAIAAAIHGDAGIWSLLVRDVIFVVLAVEGLLQWKKNRCG